jgi:hypothetical protein
MAKNLFTADANLQALKWLQMVDSATGRSAGFQRMLLAGLVAALPADLIPAVLKAVRAVLHERFKGPKNAA